MVCVQGYTVKQSSATILEAILKKHGDIAANCVLKTDSMRSSILETLCELVKQIKANDVPEKLQEIEKRVSDAKAINIDVSWLEAHLEIVQKRKEYTEMYSLLVKKKADHLLDKKAAQINLRNRRAELAAAEERSKEAKRRVELLQLVAKNLTDNFF
ncbi:uncharacterized protein LOC143560399 [Bidens hawaiensis]|uniref:uncharacterized protein LOC143560399 n=1 Tax=Bidens hawaiensis TaxID=980011 RepID=UPI00404AA207